MTRKEKLTRGGGAKGNGRKCRWKRKGAICEGKRRVVMKILGKWEGDVAGERCRARERIITDKNAADDTIIPLITSK